MTDIASNTASGKTANDEGGSLRQGRSISGKCRRVTSWNEEDKFSFPEAGLRDGLSKDRRA